MTQEERELLRQDLCARAPYGVIVKVIKYGKCYDEREKNKTVNCKIVGINRYALITDKDNVEHTYAKGYVNTPITVPIDDGDMKSLPYLRPLSSLTKEEEKELQLTFNIKASVIGEYGISSNEVWWIKDRKEPIGFATIPYKSFYNVVDWLNAHHFDYRDLILKGLALEAPEDMYKFE